MRILHNGEKGQAAMVGVAIGLIITVVIGVIVVSQLFSIGIGPTQSDDENAAGYGTAAAVQAYRNVQTLAWAAIALLALSIIVLAAVVILGMVRSGIGGAGGV